MNKNRRNLHDFTIEFIRSTCYGNLYRGACYEGGRWISKEMMFFDYTKKEIKNILKNELLSIINA